MLKELIQKNRSYRRFDENVKIDIQTLTELVDLARLSASASNLQGLKYILSNTNPTNSAIFETLKWAGYLTDWDGPAHGERPTAYILMLQDMGISQNILCDDGIAAQSIMLGAVEKGLGGCIIYSINRKNLAEALNIPERYKIIQALALGKPTETVVIDEMKDGDHKYWRDEKLVHHVPKRSLEEIILKI